VEDLADVVHEEDAVVKEVRQARLCPSNKSVTAATSQPGPRQKVGNIVRRNLALRCIDDALLVDFHPRQGAALISSFGSNHSTFHPVFPSFDHRCSN
jgi:hypothetical protein